MKYSLIDSHCDTGSVALDRGEGFFGNSLHIDLLRMEKYEYTQFFAVFISPEYKERAMERAKDIINKIKYESEKNCERMIICKNYEEYIKNTGKVKVFLSLEGGEPIKSEEDLLFLYNEGVRMAALTWNYKNHIAGGASDEGYGITDFGKKIIKKMNEIGMMIDVSHLNDKSFWDVLEISKKPVIASHSNARRVCCHKRNLTDEQFLAIKDRGGLVGINLYPEFLNEGGKAKICDVLRHIEHFLSLGGEDVLGIGADFDGVGFLPEEIGGGEDLYKLFEAMLRAGYSEKLVKKISYTNMERILNENL